MLLDELENQSIYILREAFNKFEHLAMLWSIGKDSTVLLWLARKAFFGHVPFPLVHMDTTYKIPSMIEYRDKLVPRLEPAACRRQEQGGARSQAHLSGRQGHARRMLRHAEEGRPATVLDQHHLHRRDRRRPPRRGTHPRQGTLLLAARQEHGVELRGPAAGIVGPVQDRFRAGTHIRIHPLLHWTELNIWEYIERENIPVIPLYFANEKGERYREHRLLPVHVPHQVPSPFSSGDRRGTAPQPHARARRPGAGPGERGRLRETPARRIHVI